MLSKSEQNYLNLALKVAADSTYSKQRHGAVIVSGGRVISVGTNRHTNHPKWVIDPTTADDERSKIYSVHAEIMAIGRAHRDLSGAVLYSAAINRRGHTMNAKPCKNCAGVIQELGFKRVIWTTKE